MHEKLLYTLGEAQLEKANQTLEKISALQRDPRGKTVVGLGKLKKRITAERDFLMKVCGKNFSVDLVRLFQGAYPLKGHTLSVRI